MEKKDKPTFMYEYLTRNMKNVKTQRHGHYLNILADCENKAEIAYFRYINKTTNICKF